MLQKGLAYGVDKTRKEYYSLRQSRYEALGRDINEIAGKYRLENKKLRVLDVGAKAAVLYKYLCQRPHFDNIELYGCDIDAPEIHGDINSADVHREFYQCDLSKANPDIPNAFFDVVVCEQVLEHIDALENPVATLENLVKKNGYLYVGVPIFPHGIHTLRRKYLPTFDRIFGITKIRGHVQSFSKKSFINETMAQATSLNYISSRGFRIISGGILRPLENYYFWWQFNNFLGRIAPSLCIEIQVIYQKT